MHLKLKSVKRDKWKQKEKCIACCRVLQRVAVALGGMAVLQSGWAGLLRLAPGGLAGDGWCLPWRPGLAARLPACAAERLPIPATAGPRAEGKG